MLVAHRSLVRSVLFLTALLAGLSSLTAAPPDLVKITTLAASGKGTDVFKDPQAVAIDLASGMLFVADRGHHQIAKVDPSGTVTIAAGSGKPGRTDGAGLTAQFKDPQGIAIDSVRRLIYVADSGNHLIRRMTFDGVVTTFAGSGRGEDRDGVGADASFKEPVGLAVDSAGNVLVADSGNDKIRMITPSAVVTTFAGAGRPGYSDGAVAQALFKGPRGVAVSPDGVVYVADTKNHAIRKIANGTVSTVAGTTHAGSVDGAPNVAEFKEPSGIAFDDAGDLWIADTKNHQIRRIGADGITTTIAGDGRPGYVDGTDLLHAAFHEPAAVMAAGAIFIADSKNDALRMIIPALAATDLAPRSGSPNGGDTVRIFGSGFIPGQTQVTFGGGSAASVVYVSSTELMVVTPARPVGETEVRVTTPAGSVAVAFPFRFIPPFVSITIAPASATLDVGKTIQFTATGIASDNTTTDLTSRVTWSSASISIATIDSAGLARGIAAGSTTITATFETLSRSAALTVRLPESLPPDPATVATPLDPTVASDMSKSVQFLFAGTNPIQRSVTAGVIQQTRVAVLRGRVLDGDGSPLSGVRISVLNASFYGFTLTRADGMYDLAVNGGGEVTLVFAKNGFITAQRKTQTPWRDYVVLGDVYLVGFDTKSTLVTTGAPAMQVAQGSVVTDASGSRTATILFPSGTTATIVTATGAQQPASTLTVRATELTVGPNGSQRMPADLPPTSGYTYCVELSVDEAVAVNARSVTFSKPVSFYVDNFLEFPVGMPVPVGSYDRQKGAWIAENNGVVLRIVSVDGGTAEFDITGDGVADDATSIGVSTEELARIATLFPAGKTLWRASVTHFTPWDCNWPIIPPEGANPPSNPQATYFRGVENPCRRSGSIIDCHNQVYGEVIPIDGTPFSLEYQSDHAAGYRAGYSVEIPVSGATLPQPLERIDVEIRVQGQLIKQSFPPFPHQTFRFTWDGHDGFGRELQGLQVARIRVGYVYQGRYTRPAEFRPAFGLPSGTTSLTVDARDKVTLWQDAQALVGRTDDHAVGLGGWTIDGQRRYEPNTGLVHEGSSGQRSSDLQRNIIDRFAGGGNAPVNNSGMFARDARFSLAWAIAAAPDGSVYVGEWGVGVWRVRPEGTMFLLIGPTTRIEGRALTNVQAMTIGPDEALYLVVGGTIFRRHPTLGEGTIFAASGLSSHDMNVDGIPARDANLGDVTAIAFGPDGSLYIGGPRIRRIAPDGIIYPVTGPTTLPRAADFEGRSALTTNIGTTDGLTVGIDGTVYFTQRFDSRVFAITPGGVIRRFAGATKDSGPYEGDGGPALAATMGSPGGLTVDANGSIYVADFGYWTIRRILPNGIISTVAGNPDAFGDSVGDGGPATAALLFAPKFMGTGPRGSLYVTDQYDMTARKVSVPTTQSATGQFRIPSPDGATVDIFDNNGRHLQTIDAVTNVVLNQLGYDTHGKLVTLTDAYGNVTLIERDDLGNATAVVSPFGKRTALTIDGDGNLSTLTDPAGQSHVITYVNGQITSMKNPRGIVKQTFYDADGRLTREELPDGGALTLSRAGSDRSFGVTARSGEGLEVSHQLERDETDKDIRTTIDPATGLQTLSTRTDDGVEALILPDGTSVEAALTGDPRFQTLSPLSSHAMQTPEGRRMRISMNRDVVLSNRFDPLSLRSITETVNVNGRAWKSTFTKATTTWSMRSPAGRTSTAILNAKGDFASIQVPGLAAVTYIYDAQGRVTGVHSGSRSFEIAYNARGEVERVTDSLSRSVTFEYDSGGRIKRQTLPDLRSVAFTYNANGNPTSITPPGRVAHEFDYTVRDLVETYKAPDAGITRYAYNKERQLTLVTRPDAQSIALVYDNAGRLATLTAAHGVYGYGYSVTTGNLTTITAPADNQLTFTYDGPLLTTTTWSGEVEGFITNVFDNTFRISSENGTSYQYDDDDLLVQAGPLTLRRSAQNGLLTGTTLANMTDSYTYNEFGEVTAYVATVGGTEVMAVGYERDVLGRVTEKTETVVGIAAPPKTFAYDPAGRLIRVESGTATIAEYDYDENSNRKAHRFVGGSSTAAYDAQDRLLTYDGTTYEYTANGELKTKTTDGQATTFDYDVLGNLRSVSIPGLRIDYVIDGQNRRIGKKVHGQLTRAWLYADQLRIVTELDGGGIEISRFIYGSRSNIPDFMVRNGKTYRLLSDHLGSPRLVVNTDDGTIAQRMDFDEFGNVLADTNPGFQPFGFAGGLYDLDTRLVRFGARDYDPHTARWTAKDPIGFKGRDANLYNYVFADPINFVDPSGADIWVEGPSANEPNGHLSVNVGDPNGDYSSYSFGVNGKGILEGEVYRDTSPYGAFYPGYYRKTSLAEDAVARAALERIVGNTNQYAPWRTCRNFALENFARLDDLGKPARPPRRKLLSYDKPSTRVPTGVSTSATDRGNLTSAPTALPSSSTRR